MYSSVWHQMSDVEKSDIFVIVEEDSATSTDEGYHDSSRNRLPAEFFDYFVVELAS